MTQIFDKLLNDLSLRATGLAETTKVISTYFIPTRDEMKDLETPDKLSSNLNSQ